METPILIAIISAVVSLGTLALNLESVRRNRKIEDEIRRSREIASVREPLSQAAFDLQARLYNIVERGFFDSYRRPVDSVLDPDLVRRSRYAIDHTAYLIAHYFHWSERFRQEIQSQDASRYQSVKRIVEADKTIRRAFGNDSDFLCEGSNFLMIFDGEQRSLAEMMGLQAHGRSECRGFNSFCSGVTGAENDVVAYLRRELADTPIDRIRNDPRLKDIQHKLVELVRTVDPGAVRFPETLRLIGQSA